MSAKIYKNFIGGEWMESRSGQTFENLNPADTRDVVGVFQRSDKRDVDDAVKAAQKAFERWRLVPAPKRAEIIYRAGAVKRSSSEAPASSAFSLPTGRRGRCGTFEPSFV